MAKKIAVTSGAVFVAAGIAVAMVLRHSPTGREVLAQPEHIPCGRPPDPPTPHGASRRRNAELVMRVVLIGDNAAARVAGEIYDEPTLARPLLGEELNGMLPDRFFTLQDELKARSRRLSSRLRATTARRSLMSSAPWRRGASPATMPTCTKGPPMPTTPVREIMTDVVETLRVGDTLALARQRIARGRIRHLPVVDGEERLVALITHRRILEAWVSHGHPDRESPAQVARDVPVEMLMDKDLLTVDPETSAAHAAKLLETYKFGCLPVGRARQTGRDRHRGRLRPFRPALLRMGDARRPMTAAMTWRNK